MEGTRILEEARTHLKNRIVFDGKYLYSLTHDVYPNFEKDEEYVINFTDILKKNESVKVNLSVWDDDTTTHDELFQLNSIHITLDDNLFFWDYRDEEVHFGELRIEELADIVNIVEKAVMKAFKAKYPDWHDC